MPRPSRSAAPQKATKKKAAPKAAPARAGKAASGATTRAKATKAAKATTKATKAAKTTTTTTKATRTTTKAAKATTKASAPATKTARTAAGDKFLEAQHKALLEERETYTRHASDLRAEAEQLAADREPGDVQFDEESGQGDTMNVERERDLALSAQAMAAVEDIDKALAKIDAGTYGICERCGQPIPKERLRALPYAALCVACKSGGLTTRR
jgi:RNA polymerase-binding transcription factor DksA